MEQNAAEIGALISAIETAFATVPRGVTTLHEAEVIDHYGTDAERRKAQTRDLEHDWRDVPDSSIEECLNALPHLDPVSWRFYLPAFMRFGLLNMTQPRSSMDRAIYTLALGDDRASNDHRRKRFRTLDSTQVRAVRRFLELASESEHCDAHVARQALEKYWCNATDV